MDDELFDDDWEVYEAKYIWLSEYGDECYNVAFINGDEAVVSKGKVIYHGPPESSTHDTTGDEIRKVIQAGKLISLQDLSPENQAAIQRIINL